MDDFTQTLLTHRDQAIKASQRAGQRLTRLLGTDEPDLAAAIAETLHRRAYARWWTTLIDHIHDGGTDPAIALADARDTARDALLALPIPRSACPYATAEAITGIEATRAFFHDTATLTTSPGRPSSTGQP